jgi:hypothetical protein
MVELSELLEYIPPSQLDYLEWVNVGMALKHEGYPVDTWDAWSRSDSRYKPGFCAKKWVSFKENTSKPVTGGTIYDMAVRFGYSPNKEIRVFDWEDEIEYDGDTVIKDTAWLDTSSIIETPENVGVDELRRYIQALFKPDEIVGFCIDAEYDEERKKWKPASKGSYGMTAKQILNAIKKHPDSIEDVIGDYNKEAGAWIRFNPLDGHGVANSNVTDLRYALVESDSLEIEKQKALMDELKLPVAVMVYSGAKSVHSIVKINAVTEQDYREKVDYLYRVCEKNGLHIDKQNKNQSRMSRMPGVSRGEKKQFIIAENIGLSSFEEWKEYIEDSIDTLPEIITFSELENLPPLSPELIGGILRKGHKMLISGASKAGKSFLLIELALSIVNGREWLGYSCMKGKVLYINLEVDGNSFLNRINEVRKAMGLKNCPQNLDIWNLRGENTSIDKLAPRLLRRAKNKGYDVIIFDPLYKINQADENSASEMAKFFNHLDAICVQLGTSIICCHHHSKGSQGGKFSMDRASGSGVFARDPDALLDMIQLNPRDAEVSLPDGQTAWRISATLREFKTPDDIDVIFDFPVHKITNDLKDAKPITGMDAKTNSERGNAAKTDKRNKRYERILFFIENWDEIDFKDNHSACPTVADLVDYFKNDPGFSDKSIRRQIETHDDYVIDNGFIIPKPGSKNEGQNDEKAV